MQGQGSQQALDLGLCTMCKLSCVCTSCMYGLRHGFLCYFTCAQASVICRLKRPGRNGLHELRDG